MDIQHSLSVRLPPADAEFVTAYAEAHHLSVDEVFDSLIKSLRRMTTRPIDPELASLVGILPRNTDIDALRMAYLTEKYFGDDHHR